MKKYLHLLLLAVSALQFNGNAQSLISSSLLGSKSQLDLYLQFNNLPFIQYGAKYYRLSYTTPDVHGVLDTVTGLIAVPDNPSRVYPRLVYQHGTSGAKNDVPSINVLSNGEGQLGQLFAGLGYIALLPDYLGLGNESRGFHPYVHAASEAWNALDMLRAAAAFCEQNQIRYNEQLFVTGYSQGGHAAMALHRAIENDPNQEFSVTAASHMSGPYSISGVMRQLILSDDIYYYPAYIPNTALSYQTVYGNLFNNLEEVFKPAYAGLIAQFQTGQTSLSDLNQQLIDLLITNEGASRPFRMLQPAIVEAITNNPNHPINLALKDNDTYNNWTPKAPMRILYCMNDDQVPFGNSLLAKDSLSAVAAPDFVVQDVMPAANHGQCVTPAVTATLIFFLGFQQVGSVNTAEAQRPEHLTFSPNPANDAFLLENLSQGMLEIFDFQGNKRMAAQLEPGSHQISTALLNNGSYWICFRSASGIQGGKLVVQH